MPWKRVETNIPGYTVGVWEPPVPRISTALLDCAAYLYQSVEDAREGCRPGASGLLLPHAYAEGCSVRGIHVYVVTNAHVACVEPRATVVRLRRRDGESVVIDPGVDAWVRHPNSDDVAICKLDLDSPEAFRLVTPLYHWKPRPPFDDEDGVILGREVVMVGRFLGLDGREKNTPTLRFGNIAAPQVEPVRNEKFGIDQESFLVEMRSLPGYSGAPVFVLPDPWHQVQIDPVKRKFAEWSGDKTKVAALTPDYPRPIRDPRDLALLGITWCHFDPPHRLVDREGRELEDEHLYSRSNSGMAGVVPWWKIWELLDEPYFKEARKDVERVAEEEARRTNAVLD